MNVTTRLPMSITLNRSNARSFETMSLIASLLAVTSHAARAGVGFKETGYARVSCPAMEMEILVPISAYFESFCFNSSLPEEVVLQFIKPLGPAPNSISLGTSTSLVTLATGAVFAPFFERAKDWASSNISGDFAKWPPSINFARIIRNAIVHDYRITFRGNRPSSGHWRGRTISNMDHGKSIFRSGEYNIGDLILLTLDVDRELESAGAPIHI